MAKCSSCSAPLPANTQYCSYCGVRNDVDLLGKHEFQVVQADRARICPACGIGLQTIALDAAGVLHIERCEQCFGLFFDNGEIEALLDGAVEQVGAVNLALLDNINLDRYPKQPEVKYLKCPSCQVLMNRKIFGYRSGVVVNQCKIHGIWLDGGQISHLLEWKKAGGQLLNQQKIADQQARASAEQFKKAFRKDHASREYGYDGAGTDGDLAESIAGLIFKMFE